MSDKLLLKSLKKPYKYHIIFFLLIFISIVFINTVTLFYEALLDMKYNNNKYGTYHGILYNMDAAKLRKLSEERSVDKVIRFERNSFKLSGGATLFLDAVPENYFDFTEYELTSGRFPKNHSEICCESSFLLSRVISNNFIGSKIMLGEKEYTVTGTFTSHRLWSTLPNYYVQCFTSEPIKPNAAAFSLKNIKRCDAVVAKYDNDPAYCEYNMNHWAIKSNSFQHRELYMPLLVVMFSIMAAVFIHCVSMLLMYHNKNIGILSLVGIPRKTIRKCVFLSILKTIAIAGVSGVLCSVLLLGEVEKIYEYAYSSDVTSFVYKKGILIVCLLSLILTAIYILSLILTIFQKTRKSDLQNVKNEYSVKTGSRISADRLTNYGIAKRHIKNARLSNVLTFITICFLICMIPIFKLYFSSVTQDVKMYEGYDYVAEIIEHRLPKNGGFSGSKTYDYVRYIADPVIDGCISVPIYSKTCALNVYKETISDEYAELLKKDYQYELSNNYSDTIRIPFIIIGITYERQKQLGIELKKNEAIAYRNLINSNKNIIGVKLENYSKIPLDEENELEIIGVKNEYDDLLPTSKIANVLMINMETFSDLFGKYPVPSRIFYKVNNESRNELIDILAKKDFVKLKDISEIQGNNKYLNICDSINLFIILAAFLFLLINCCITAYISIQRNIREYAIMSAIGISNCNISLMVIYQVCGVIISSLIVSDILALIITDIKYADLTYLSRIQIPMPYMEIIISNLIVISACVLICTGFLNRFWKLASNWRLHNQ